MDADHAGNSAPTEGYRELEMEYGGDAIPEHVFALGDVVQLSTNVKDVEEAFDSSGFRWDDLMAPMCGQTFKVLEIESALIVGLESPDGTQNNVWYFPVSVLTLIRRKDEEAIIMKYAVFIGKASAGAIRTLLEDLLQLSCQVIFLIKKWKLLEPHMKVYTLSSITAGMALAVLGPTKEYLSMRNMRAKAKSKRPTLLNSLGLDADNSAMAVSTCSAQKTQGPFMAAAPGTYTLRDTSIVELVTGKGYMKKHSEQVHQVLVGTATFYWCLMLLMFAFDNPACGEQTPRWKWLSFVASTLVDFVAQLWISLHGRQGYKLLIFNFRKILFGTFLSVLGHFDTFADVNFTSMISECEPITWFSIKDTVYNLPLGLSLQNVANFTLIVGVFMFQAVPGILFLVRKQWLPMIFKINEFNLLLTVMEFEADMQEQGE